MKQTVFRILSYVLGVTGMALVIPLAVAYCRSETQMLWVFAVPMLMAWAASLAFFLRSRGRSGVIGMQEAFAVVGLLWAAECVFGAIPLYFSGVFPTLADAVFESVSGFTTTGATVLGDVENIPSSVNVWRCTTHWLGGIGVVALGVAMVPLLGAGGFRLIKAESSGPDKSKVTSSIAATAKMLWLVYCLFTLLLYILLRNAGMESIHALCHAFSIVSTGGFSSRNASIGAFGLPEAEWIAVVFMLLCSVNFALFCRLLTGRVLEVARNSELRAFAVAISIAVAMTFASLLRTGSGLADTLRDSVFQVASIISTTGMMTKDYTSWPAGAQITLAALFFVGGCAGSTAGGVKVVRWTVLAKLFINELRRLVHPYGVFTLRMNSLPVRDSVVHTVASFMFAYLALVLASAFAGAMAGLDVESAFTGALSMLGNVGPAFGGLGPAENYGGLPQMLKWWYSLLMLAGRLEIYTLLLAVAGFLRYRSDRR